MSDHYFPISVPSEAELRLMLLVRYLLSSVKTKKNFFTVKVWNWELNIPSEPGTILLPVSYKEHLHHFLWRKMIFMEVIQRCSQQEINIVPTASPLLKRYIMYMDAIAEGLLTTARKRQGDANYRSCLFDMYLNIEYFVGRHEFHVAGQWRESHPNTILECQDPFQLDWTTVYKQHDEKDSVFTGAAYNFDIWTMPDADWQLIADQAALYLGFSNPPPKGCKKRQKAQAQACAPNAPKAPTASPSKGKGKEKALSGPSVQVSMLIPEDSIEVDKPATASHDPSALSPLAVNTHQSRSRSATTSHGTSESNGPAPAPVSTAATAPTATITPSIATPSSAAPITTTPVASTPPTICAPGGSTLIEDLNSMDSIAAYHSN